MDKEENMEEVTEETTIQSEDTPQRKIPLWQNPKTPIVVALVVVVLGILGVGINLYLKTIMPLPPTPSLPFLKEVTITTDKTEYEQGEVVKIDVKNQSTEEVGVNSFFTIEKLVNDSWVEVEKSGCCGNPLCDYPLPLILNPSQTKNFEWDQREEVCGVPPKILHLGWKQVPPGKYRAEIGVSNLGSKGLRSIIYSNEFKIKEKEADTSKTSSMLDTIMDYIKRNHPDAATFIKEDIFWNESNVDIKPGYSSYDYTGDGWTVIIGYPSNLERVYEVKAEYPQRILWTGTIKDNVITETSYMRN